MFCVSQTIMAHHDFLSLVAISIIFRLLSIPPLVPPFIHTSSSRCIPLLFQTSVCPVWLMLSRCYFLILRLRNCNCIFLILRINILSGAIFLKISFLFTLFVYRIINRTTFLLLPAFCPNVGRLSNIHIRGQISHRNSSFSYFVYVLNRYRKYLRYLIFINDHSHKLFIHEFNYFCTVSL